MKTEFQIVVDTQSGLCESVNGFKNLLSINSKISVDEKTILFSQKKFNYKLSLNKIVEQNQNIFNLTIFIDNDINIQVYEKLLRLVREILYKVSLSINTLWDDLSIKYATEAYPIINWTENLLRKLITKFMVTNVGLSWSNENLPKDIKQIISDRKKEKTSYANILHNTDFIDLSDFLFKAYSNKSIDELFDKIKNKSFEVKSHSDIHDYVPKSNWERYFSFIVDCEDKFFIKRWNRLYELRCLIAHNNIFTQSDLNELVELTQVINKILDEALNKIDKVVVPKENKNDLLENTVINTNETSAIFISKWKEIEKEVLRYISKHKSKYSAEKRMEIRTCIIERNSIKIKLPYKNKINELMNIRNKIVHQGNPIIDERLLSKYLKEMDEVLRGL